MMLRAINYQNQLLFHRATKKWRRAQKTKQLFCIKKFWTRFAVPWM